MLRMFDSLLGLLDLELREERHEPFEASLFTVYPEEVNLGKEFRCYRLISCTGFVLGRIFEQAHTEFDIRPKTGSFTRPWYLYKMVAQNMLRTYDFFFGYLQQIEMPDFLHMCAS